jgi:hypothetical protein
MNFSRALAAVAVAALLGIASPRAQTAVDLELVLAVDASRSIDEWEYGLQRDGYVAALTDPRVLKAITSGPVGRIAICYVEWSNSDEQAKLVDWTIVAGAADAASFAELLRNQPRRFYGRTSISGAIDFSAHQIASNAYAGTRRTIDVSGDGINNQGRQVTAARDDAVEAGITINGLAIINDRPQRFPNPPIPLDAYYRDNVIGGPGGFMMVVNGFQTFGEAITKKLILEIAGTPDAAPGNSIAERR